MSRSADSSDSFDGTDAFSDGPPQTAAALTRRGLLGALPAAAVFAAGFDPLRLAAALAAAPPAQIPPGRVAQDEDFWTGIAEAFTQDRSLINLNHGGVSPSPAVVQQAEARHLRHAHAWPPSRVLWGGETAPALEAVRRKLASTFGADPETLALTRNATESLQTCQLGLDLQPGDELLTSDQDYPRMLAAFRQREQREGLRLVTVPLPVPAADDDELVARFENALTPRTRLLLISHMVNLTGQVLPVRRLVAMARARGVPVIVDGAHALAHLDFRLSELDCDYYGASLHKWLCAPHGTGLLMVRRERIAGLWPLLAADAGLAQDIRKFEEIGTHPVAGRLAIAEALDFHLALGAARKLARLVHLRDLWLAPLLGHERVALLTDLGPGRAGGIATLALRGLDSARAAGWLWERHRIVVTPIGHPDVNGLRVSPSVCTRPAELERLTDALQQLLRHGLPA